MAQRFNHMELTYEKGQLTDRLREEISRFYEEVFDWMPLDVDILGQNALLLRVDEEVSQFILVAEGRRPIHSPGYDHLGILLDTREEVDLILERCQKWQERDDRLQLKLYKDLPQGDVTVHAFYVKYLLPIWLDVQCMEWKPGTEPARKWSYG